jgi:hypothetical protein
MANHRTGRARGYSGQKGGSHTIAWRQDQVILARIGQVRELRARKLTYLEIAATLEISADTVKEDLSRGIELAKDEAADALQIHLDALNQLAREIRSRLEATGNQSLNVGQLYGQLRQIEMDIAKLDGSLIDRQRLDVEATLHNGDRDVDAEIDAAVERIRTPRLGPGDQVYPRLVGSEPGEVAPAGGEEAGAATA